MSAATSNSLWNDAEANKLPETVNGLEKKNEIPKNTNRKRIVVVGLGMVGIAFIEKLLKYDVKRREYDIVVFGEEPYLAYNRVGLTSFFQHRKVENMYLNPQEWYTSMPEGALSYQTNTLVTEIDKANKTIKTSKGEVVSYDILVLATGSDALLPRFIPGWDAKGVYLYRTIEDIYKLIEFSATVSGTTGAVIGGGLLGLEAAKAMMDLEQFSKVKVIERSRWLLSRQVDEAAGAMVAEQVSALGLDVMCASRVDSIVKDENGYVKGIKFEDQQEEMPVKCVCFAIGVKARDEIARKSGIKCTDRGTGIIVDDNLQTSEPDIYAIGECASWENQCYGLIAPGVEMADILAFNLTQAKAHTPRTFKRPDLSTKLKLLGVEVASFGDYFADVDGPRWLPGKSARRGSISHGPVDPVKQLVDGPAPHPVKCLTYEDPFQHVYKKYLFTLDGEYLLGGIMIGDTRDYVKLLPMAKNHKKLEIPPAELILGAQKEDGGDDLPDDTQICSCHNVTKADIVNCAKDGSAKSIGDVKSLTKAGTGCGGCVPLVTTIFNKTLASMGQEIKNNLCPHFDYSRADLFNIIYVKKLTEFADVMKEAGKDPNSVGCEACKPVITSIITSTFNKHVVDPSRRGLQETNDRFLANIQRNGTFSVVPRMAGGEITPEKLIIIGTVAKKYGLYCKVTGGQRIDMFGAKKHDLPNIWRELVEGGMESGHAYAKSLRTVKSCVGTTWCRFGVGDSVGMAVRLEERYKSIRGPHKFKGGVSGCVRECAEAQNKDFGLIATEKGFNIFVGGNGGAKPRHSELLATDVPPDDVIPILDRYLAFYIRTADKLQRTARWIENLPGGIKYLQDVILKDKLGICAELEKQMGDLVDTFFCEWTEVLKDPVRLAHFNQFANTSDNIIDTIEPTKERGQQRPSYWPKDGTHQDFKNTPWKSLSWQPIVKADEFIDTPTGDSKAVKRGDTQLAIFKIKGKWYCTQQMCPHKRAFVLADGLIGDDTETGKLWVSCPYHKRNYELEGEHKGNCSNDESVNIATFDIEERADGYVYVKLPTVQELDSVLGTEKWKIKKDETKDPYEKLDRKLNELNMKGRKALKVSHLEGAPGEDAKAAQILAGQERGAGGLDW